MNCRSICATGPQARADPGALLSRNQFAYELGYFWGLGGTLQAMITPDVGRGFPGHSVPALHARSCRPDRRSAVSHLWAPGLRPVPKSLPRVIAATLLYVALAGVADYALGTNYGFLRGKGDHVSLLTWLAPWPWYIGELVLIGLLSVAVYYAPFFVVDRSRRPKHPHRDGCRPAGHGRSAAPRAGTQDVAPAAWPAGWRRCIRASSRSSFSGPNAWAITAPTASRA